MRHLFAIAFTLVSICLNPVQLLAKTDMPATHKSITQTTDWLNTSRALTQDDLKGRIILLDFWTFCCINCMHVIPDLKYLEDTFGSKLTVIGVHSAKFKNERDTSNIRSAILRYGIEHPVVNDANFNIWQDFSVRAWPTFVLIDPNGGINKIYSGEGNRMAIEDDVRTLIKKFSDTINTSPLPLALEKNKVAPTLLSFPSKLALSPNGLFISDSGHHRIVETSTEGQILTHIGSGTEGYKDGSFEEAQFRRPQGILYKDNKLYIADTENHALRLADLSNRTVTTLAGSGVQGNNRWVQDSVAPDTKLASPWDLAFYPDDHHILIAMAGTHQLWVYNTEQKTLSVVAGNGRESIDDGKYPTNSLSQPSGLSVYGDTLYFVDSETSSLRTLKHDEIHTLIGTGLFNFGYEEGKRRKALMQHPLGVYADGNDIYVADSYNHSIRRYNIQDMKLHNFAGNSTRGFKDGSIREALFNEPNDIKRIGDILYIADTNNHHIRMLNLNSLEVKTLAFTDLIEKAHYTLSSTLPNLTTLPAIGIRADTPINITFGLAENWKVNHEAPSYLALFEDNKNVQGLDKDQLQEQDISLQGLEAEKTYRLQGTIYYCANVDGSECLIKSFDQELHVTSEGASTLKLILNEE